MSASTPGTIELNCDLGEAIDEQGIERERSLLRYIQRSNIACGGHAGTIETMRTTLNLCKSHQVICGAHPGYPDRENFGRLPLEMPMAELTASLQRQIDSLLEMAERLCWPLAHIKFHGALYNKLEQDEYLAQHLADWQARHYPKLAVLAIAHGQYLDACQSRGLSTIGEAFMDRLYLSRTALASRNQPGAVFNDPQQAAAQALAIACGKPFSGHDSAIMIEASSICLHGDSPHAVPIIEALQQTFARHQIRCQPYAG